MLGDRAWVIRIVNRIVPAPTAPSAVADSGAVLPADRATSCAWQRSHTVAAHGAGSGAEEAREAAGEGAEEAGEVAEEAGQEEGERIAGSA